MKTRFLLKSWTAFENVENHGQKLHYLGIYTQRSLPLLHQLAVKVYPKVPGDRMRMFLRIVTSILTNGPVSTRLRISLARSSCFISAMTFCTPLSGQERTAPRRDST